MSRSHDPLPEKWRRFRKRPPEDRRLILHAALLLPLTEIGLRFLGFRRWKELIEEFFLSTPHREALPEELQWESAARVVRALRSAALHGLTEPNCLERSMTLWWLLRRDGIDGELHIGARKENGQFQAHAWIELGGKVLNDGDEVHHHYSRFDAPIAAAAEDFRVRGKAATR